VYPVRATDRVEPMDRMRRLTARHMVLAKRVAPHVHSFIEIDFSRIDRIRKANRARWEEQGARVSFTSFVAWAVARGAHLVRVHDVEPIVRTLKMLEAIRMA
jgi:pyruvate/2-oxoglutarate dehydrogenase complex dihydrolipoamide acyltransferase (E2) component